MLTQWSEKKKNTSYQNQYTDFFRLTARYKKTMSIKPTAADKCVKWQVPNCYNNIIIVPRAHPSTPIDPCDILKINVFGWLGTYAPNRHPTQQSYQQVSLTL